MPRSRALKTTINFHKNQAYFVCRAMYDEFLPFPLERFPTENKKQRRFQHFLKAIPFSQSDSFRSLIASPEEISLRQGPI